MSDRNSLTLRDLLQELRERLISARDENNERELACLGYAFTMIEDLAGKHGDGPTAKLAMHMEEAVRDSIMGELWKSTIPSIDDIDAAFKIHT